MIDKEEEMKLLIWTRENYAKKKVQFEKIKSSLERQLKKGVEDITKLDIVIQMCDKNIALLEQEDVDLESYSHDDILAWVRENGRYFDK